MSFTMMRASLSRPWNPYFEIGCYQNYLFLTRPQICAAKSRIAFQIGEYEWGYRNKTYVIFDADEDMWAYGFMLGWKSRDHIDFDFHNAHDLNTITDRASEDTTKRKLRERFSNAKQVVVLVGTKTKNLYRFVRWEIEVALDLKLPIVVANLNEKRRMDDDLCPPILKGKDAIHVAFKMNVLKHAMDHFVDSYPTVHAGHSVNWYYPDDVYRGLGL